MNRSVLRPRKPDIRFWVTFFSTVLFGLAAQGMGLLNKFSYHDDIFALFWTGTTIASGRWMLHVIGWLETLIFGKGHFSLPAVNGLFAICCIGLSAGLIADLLEIRSLKYRAGLGALMVSFPVVTGLFGFMFTLPYYMLAMLMMVFSAYLICRADAWWAKLAAVLVGSCSIGIYQAFLPLLLSLPLLYDFMLLADSKLNVAAFLKKATLQLICITASVMIYFALNRFFIAKFAVELNSYMGINQMESTPAAVYLERILLAYREFFLPTRNVPSDMYPMHVHYMYLGMLVADVLMAGRLLMLMGKREKGKGMTALAVLILLLFPLGCNFIYVMAENVHGLMTYGLIAQFALFIALAERLELRHPKLRRAASTAVAAALALTAVMYIRFDNQCYLKAAFQQQQAISYYTTLAGRIQSAEGYGDEVPVAFLNAEEIQDQSLYNINELNFIHLDSYGDTMESYLNSYAWSAFMQRWCGFSPEYADPASCENLPEVQTMPHYPDDGSIQRVGDMMVVNF